TFANKDDIKAVRLSDSVTKLEFDAFSGCTGLKLFASGSRLEVIDESAFQRCKSLREVRLNESLKTIKDLAFEFCSSLERLEIPSSVEDISEAPAYKMSDVFTMVIKE